VNTNFPIPVSAVAIDLDGTLLDTATDLAIAANRMLADFELRPLDTKIIRTFIGKGVSNLVRRALAAAGGSEPDDALIAQALERFRVHYGRSLSVHTRPYPGVMEGVIALKTAGFPLACVTNKAAAFTLPLLQQTGFAPFFDLTVCGDTLPRKKPHPLPLLYSASVFAVPPPGLLAIGDSANDTECARAAGCPVFCVSYGYHEGYEVAKLGADAVIDSLREAGRLICFAPPGEILER